MGPPAPRGFLRINMPNRDHKFKLRAGGLPDAHLPWAFRLGRARYQTLELYGLWVKGGELEADPFFYEDAVETGEDIDYRCQASRVARLLNTVLPAGFEGTFSDADSFDTRCSAVSQHATFARHGWPAAPPTAGQLMVRMVRYAENDCNLESLRYPRGSQALAPTQKQYLDYDGYEKSSADDQDADIDDMADPEEWVDDEYYRMAADAAANEGHTA